ncbi:hypothetical protein HU200_018682 [Digitaria exilis]|uniref:Uncharacterized protein n=1 Tax=Digitaria exilis TaxID=1010633 RepID=A0A835F4K1_9POAL|nr:hypothetical protein HU200_018682 [Digitaria exilis]CAB3500155.1 unnamed protein product [Digitaria exilis]
MTARVWDVLASCQTARSAYLRVLARPTVRMVAQNAILLLIWMEAIGFNLIEKVASMAIDDSSLTNLVYEANALYNYVLYGHYGTFPPPSFPAFQTITALCTAPRRGRLIDHRFFVFHKNIIARGVAMYRDNAAGLVFNDHLYAMLDQYETDSNSSWIPNPVPAPALMAPYVAYTTTTPEDKRTCFVAFDERQPLTSQEILDYFQRTLLFGHCIERVDTEQAASPTQRSKHGMIVFRSEQMRNDAMMGEPAAFFLVDGRDMWVQPYDPSM